MAYPFYDSTMLLLIPGIILAFYAQMKVKSTFAKYSQVRSAKGVNGAQAARAILDSNGLEHVGIEMIQGNLTDHYDPRTKIVRLSSEVYQGQSLASLGVAAHETGHAVQHSTGYLPLNIRNSLVPVANIGSNAAIPLLLLGIFMGFAGLAKLGIYLFVAVVLFQLITLPVEFNASGRAIGILQSEGYISGSEIQGTKAVLDAAALTYVAAALMSLLNLVRLIAIFGGFGRRDD